MQNDAVSGAIAVLLIALGLYGGRLYERRTNTRSKDEELKDAVKNLKTNLDARSDADLIKSVAESGTVKRDS